MSTNDHVCDYGELKEGKKASTSLRYLESNRWILSPNKKEWNSTVLERYIGWIEGTSIKKSRMVLPIRIVPQYSPMSALSFPEFLLLLG